MSSQASICAPVRASVRTVRETGLPSESLAATFVRQASFGEPCRASTTSCGVAVSFFNVSPRLTARRAFAARSAAFGADMEGVTEERDILLRVARFALRYAPSGARWT